MDDLLLETLGKQTTTEVSSGTTGALRSLTRAWKSIDFRKALRQVRRLQRRIAKAVDQGRWNKVKALQRILTRSFFAEVLAVKKGTSNRGARTPGVDGVCWTTPAQKMRGARSLSKRRYRALPLRRIHIPKKPGSDKTRPIGIPTIRDRAMQALEQLALEPVAETQADPNSYGFRPYRAVRDAIGQCFCIFGKKSSRCEWVLEADIKSCFDEISQAGMQEHIAMDRKLLRQWLKCGYVLDGELFPTTAGTPQGGIISPMLCNCVLDGLEATIRRAVPRPGTVYFVRYADDFIVASDRRETLEQTVLPAIEKFLAERGLRLSAEKTSITHIEEGFNFLGKHLRKFAHGKLIITPSKKNVKAICAKIRETARKCRGLSAATLIGQLNPIVRGWAQAHRTVQAARTFSVVGQYLFDTVWRWCRRSHRKKNKRWIFQRYFRRRDGQSGWGRFHTTERDRSGQRRLVRLLVPGDIPLVRYIKVRGKSNPHAARDGAYFQMRRKANNYRELPSPHRRS